MVHPSLPVIKLATLQQEHPWIKQVTHHILLTSNSGAPPCSHLSPSPLWQRQETLLCRLCKGSHRNVKFVCLCLSSVSICVLYHIAPSPSHITACIIHRSKGHSCASCLLLLSSRVETCHVTGWGANSVSWSPVSRHPWTFCFDNDKPESFKI